MGIHIKDASLDKGKEYFCEKINLAFSCIIPFHNSSETIRPCLDALLKNNHILEVILVDDHSSDATVSIIRNYQERNNNIKYVRNTGQQGAGAARNFGTQIARGEILIFLDSDIIIPSNLTSRLVDYFFGNEIAPQPDAVVANREKEGLYRDAISLYKNYWTSFNLSEIKGWTSFLNSSLFAIKKTVFTEIGGFNNIPLAEDNELGYRLAKNGFKIYFARDLSVFHKRKFTYLSLLKRELMGGREGIKVKVRYKTFSDFVKDRKFFAVRENFIYSLPLSLLFIFFSLAFFVTLQPAFLFLSVISIILVIFVNINFLSYASCSKDFFKGAVYIGLLLSHLSATAIGLAAGIIDLLRGRVIRVVLLIRRYSRAFIRLFKKNYLSLEQATFFVTNSCNLKCQHCFLGEEKNYNGKELTVEEFGYIAKKIGSVNFLTITGGEPFLRDDIVEIVKVLIVNLKPTLVTILTNGYLTDRIINRVKQILEFSCYQDILIKISLDGSPEIHDKLRMAKGAFKNAHATYIKLKGMKDVYRNLRLGIITTYTQQNKDEIEPFYEEIVTKLMPDQHSLVLERPEEANELNKGIDIDNYVGLAKKMIIKSASSVKGLFNILRLAYKIKMLNKLREVYATEKYPMECFAGILNAVINPYGDVFACEQLKDAMGNLRETNYEWRKVWQSDKAEEIRVVAKRKCFCTNECYMPFNLLYNIRELPDVVGLFIRIAFSRRTCAERNL